MAEQNLITQPNLAPVHIAFGVDAGYFRGMGVLIASLRKNNPDLNFVFHVFAFSLSEDNRLKLARLEEMPRTAIRLHLLDTSLLKAFTQFPCFAANASGMFIRLLIPGLLRGIRKILYLDADILCLGSIHELLAVDIDDCVAAVVHDEAETTAQTQIPALGLRHGAYFNSGVMYINVDNWIACGVENATLALLSEREFVFADQDALNIVLDGRVRYVDEKWNTRYHLVARLSAGETRLALPRLPVFIHFTGPVKPWQDWCLHEARDIFREYQALSPWSGMPPDQPKTARDLKLYSRFLMRQHRVWKGIYWHLKYLGRRFLQRLK
ncbi:glycosyltransferase [Oxalobacteraceae bacterium CAVE-383]|nr:glycosyltransferase [Oxalobacteraceae bacterium CAVE-383]